MQPTYSNKQEASSDGWRTVKESQAILNNTGLVIRDTTARGYGYRYNVFDIGSCKSVLASKSVMLNDTENLAGGKGTVSEMFNIRDLRKLKPSLEAKQMAFDEQVRSCLLEMQRLFQSAKDRGLRIRADISELLANEFANEVDE